MTINLNSNKVKIKLLNLLFFFILFSPAVFQKIKIAIILPLLFLVILEILNSKRVNIHPHIFWWIIIYIFTNLFFLVKGTHDNFNVFIQLFPSKILWPILYMLILIIATGNLKHFNLRRIFIL